MIKFLHRLEEWALIALLTTLTLLGFFEAVARQLGHGTLWAGDLVKWLSAWFLLIGIPYGVRSHAHIGLTILTERLHNALLKRLITIVALSICLIYCGTFLTSSYQYVMKLKTIGFTFDNLPVQLWIPYSGLLYCFIVLAWRFLVLLYQVITNKAQGFGYLDEAHESVVNLAQIEKEAQL